jgi:hypothetical protein
MLPEEFDPGRLNLLPVSSGARAWLASHSRLYLFGYLRLRTHAWNMTSGEQVNPIVAAPTCQSREVIWQPLQERYRRLKALTERLGASLRVVILGGQLWEGAPLRRVHEILGSESIPFLDLTPVWRDRDYYASTYTLGWDPHPNAQANALSAELIAAFLNLPPDSASADPYTAIRARPDLAPLIDPWRARQQQAEMAHAKALGAAAASLPRSLELGSRQGAGEAGQLLYGFWDPDAATGLPGGETGRWISSRGAVLLGWSGSGAEIEIDLQSPRGAAARSRAPRTARVTVGVPPDQCGVVTREFPLDFSLPSQRLTLSIALPGSAAGPLEVQLAAAPFEAGLLGSEGRDPRLVSLLVSRITAH